MPVVALLKYDSYGETSIVNDWVGAALFICRYPRRQ